MDYLLLKLIEICLIQQQLLPSIRVPEVCLEKQTTWPVEDLLRQRLKKPASFSAEHIRLAATEIF